MKSLIRTIFILIILAGVIVGVLGYLGLIPQIAKIVGSDKPRDLGIKYTDKILLETREKSGVEVKTLMPTDNPAETISYMGKHAMETSFSSEELTAAVNNRTWKYNPVSNVQIKIPGNEIEASGYLLTDRIIGFVLATGGSKFDISMVMRYVKLPGGKIPFYVKTTGEMKSNNLTFNVSTLEAGRLPLPLSLVNRYKPQITEFIQEREDFVRGLSIDSLTLVDGKMNFKGTLPDLEGLTP